MKKTNLIFLSVLCIIALTVWFSCNPFQNYGKGSSSVINELDESDIVKATATTNVWTWVSGGTVVKQPGVYGTKGIANSANVPGARYAGLMFRDSGNNIWLFGGEGYDGNGKWGWLNDLWKFDGTNWTWVSGSNIVNQKGVYGTKGIASAANIPGARYESIGWIDSNNNIWVFGGDAADDNGNPEDEVYTYNTNDLWKFDGTSWTWVKGSNLFSQNSIIGTKGVPNSSNTPGARRNSQGWIDNNNNLWLLGGNGHGVAVGGYLNDLWKFNGTDWIWMAGKSDNASGTSGTNGIYGTKGVPSSSNYPGSRMGSQTWIDSKGIFWLFGGSMFDAVGNLGLGMAGYGNDLWKYDGTYWTWVSGSNLCNNDAIGNYGSLGVTSSTNQISYRQYMEGWTDASDNLWIFAGYGAGRTTGGGLNNIWKYDGTYWTWMAGNDEGIGSNPAAVKGIYGTKGSPDSANVPGARYFSMGCLDKSGNFWIFGGQGVDGNGTQGYLNDLWMYKP